MASDLPLRVELDEVSAVASIDEWLSNRIVILERLALAIEAVHQASSQGVFPRWTQSGAFLVRVKFALASIILLRHLNGTKTASGSSLLVQFLLSRQFEPLDSPLEEQMVLVLVQFGSWMFEKGLYELALMWMDSFEANVLASTSPLESSQLAAFFFVRGKLCLALDRLQEAIDYFLQTALLYPADNTILTIELVWEGTRLSFLKHCIDLAVAFDAPEVTRQLASQALLYATDASMETLCLADEQVPRLEIAQSYFKALLQLGRPKEAFSSLSLVPEHGWEDCVTSLVNHILATDKSLLVQLPWGRWSDLVVALLEAGTKGDISYYRLLFALHSTRSDFQAAATCLYRLASQLQACHLFGEAHSVLILAKQTLLLASQDPWIIIDGQLITVPVLGRMCVLVEAQDFALRRKETVISDVDELVSVLFVYGDYQLAIKLLQAHQLPLEPVIIELVQQMVIYQSSAVEVKPETLEWVDLWLEGTECVLANPAASIGKVIQSCLDQLKEPHLWCFAAECVLQNSGTLPSWLKDGCQARDPERLARLLK